jgi:hypothetical protein
MIALELCVEALLLRRRRQEKIMRLMKSSIAAATLLATVVGANAQSREELNTGYHGATTVKRTGQAATFPAADDYRGAYASAHNHRHRAPQSGVSTPASPTLDNYHGGPAR